jgi:hypothetical protein
VIVMPCERCFFVTVSFWRKGESVVWRVALVAILKAGRPSTGSLLILATDRPSILLNYLSSS